MKLGYDCIPYIKINTIETQILTIQKHFKSVNANIREYVNIRVWKFFLNKSQSSEPQEEN